MKITQISKLLAVFVTIASVGFVGFAVATTFGGPNWGAMLDDEAYLGYRVTKTPGSEGPWVATRGSDEGQVASSRVHPEVIAKVMDEVAQQFQQETQQLQEREPAITTKIERLQASRQIDVQALNSYVEQLRQRLQQTRNQEGQVAAQVVAATNESQKIESQIEARREDVLRLQQQVEELKADQFRLQEIKIQLQDLLNQLRGNLELATQRNTKLQER